MLNFLQHLLHFCLVARRIVSINLLITIDGSGQKNTILLLSGRMDMGQIGLLQFICYNYFFNQYALV